MNEAGICKFQKGFELKLRAIKCDAKVTRVYTSVFDDEWLVQMTIWPSSNPSGSHSYVETFSQDFIAEVLGARLA